MSSIFKLFFVLALVCVVKSSVITVNVIDDDPKTEVHNLKDCNFQACDQLCRRLGYPGGACVNGRCDCDHFLRSEDSVCRSIRPLSFEESYSWVNCNSQDCNQGCRQVGYTPKLCAKLCRKCIFNSANDIIENENSLSESTESVSTRSCNNNQCVKDCVKKGYAYGRCVFGRCRCQMMPLQAEVIENADTKSTSESDESLESRKKCNIRDCIIKCNKLGYYTGSCATGPCTCRDFPLQDELPETLHKSTESVSERGCNLRACEQMCRRLGFPSGVCVNGRCKCDNFLRNEETQTHPESTEWVSERGCNLRACEQQCRRLGFPGGVCVNGRCKCDNFLRTEDEVTYTLETQPESTESVPERACNLRACEQRCRRLGFPSGVCVNGRCKCDNFLRNEDKVTYTLESQPESTESVSERGCNLRACEQLCRRLGFPSGVCINGRCKCDNFLRNEDEVTYTLETHPEPTESVSERACNVRACEQSCRRLGFPSGVCVNGRCKCDNFLRKEVPVPITEITDAAQNEKTYLIVKEDEDELSEPSFRSCDSAKCNQMCRFLNYRGGWCRQGQCQCY